MKEEDADADAADAVVRRDAEQGVAAGHCWAGLQHSKRIFSHSSLSDFT